MVSEGKYIEYSWVLISVFARLVVSKGMYMEIAIFCLQVRNKVSPRHLTPCAVASPQTLSIKWPVRVTPEKTQLMLVDRFTPAPGQRTPL